MTVCVEKRFNVAGLELVGKAWHDDTLFPVIALHGWLDNAASFDVLAPQLKHCHILALDLAGHGHSGHRPGLAPYNIWEDLAEIIAVADQQGWQQFGLLGHSRGAMVSTLLAGAFPARVAWLGLIDGLLPEPADPAEAPEQLAKSIRSVNKQLGKTTAVYDTLASAVEARKNGGWGLSKEAAQLITERGIIATDNGYRWRSDQKLRAASALRLTRPQIEAFLQKITMPHRLVLASEGMPKWFPQLIDVLEAFPAIQTERFTAGHHLHMEAEATAVAALFNQQLASIVAEQSNPSIHPQLGHEATDE